MLPDREEMRNSLCAVGTTIYLYDGDNVVQETDASGTAVARYPQGMNIDEPLAMFRSGAASYYHADGLGSVTSLSNTAGGIVNGYTYNTFGNVTAGSGTLVNNLRYTGREWDTETGLYYYRARYYDSTVGRFNSEDPVEFGSGQMNFYSYVSNSPVVNFDPTGLARCIYWINGAPNGSGWMDCWPDNPRDHGAHFMAASGNNGDPEHHCMNNPSCAAQGATNAHPGYGPIPPGWWYWGGISQSHARTGGRHLYPVTGTTTNVVEKRRGILTHWCANPFSTNTPAPGHNYCSEGCIAATQADIDALNTLLDAEPGSTLFVTPIGFGLQ